MNGYTTESWGELFLAEAGASAALGGLLFVAVSINLNRIIAIRSLPGAALGSIVLLVAVLMVSTFALVPGQPRWVLATEVSWWGSLPGLEPGTSSVSAIDGWALYYPAFPQLALIHEWHRDGVIHPTLCV